MPKLIENCWTYHICLLETGGACLETSVGITGDVGISHYASQNATISAEISGKAFSVQIQ
jgi:hypothetical protein